MVYNVPIFQVQIVARINNQLTIIKMNAPYSYATFNPTRKMMDWGSSNLVKKGERE